MTVAERGAEAAPRADDRFATKVWLVALVGLVVRLVLGRFEPLPPTTEHIGSFRGKLVADETWYVHVASSVLHGHGFRFDGVQTALHGPLAVLLLVPATLLEPHGYTAQRLTMAVLGSLSIVVLAYVGRELGGPRVGVLTAVLAALYAGLWVNDLVATSETPAILLLCVVLLLALRYRRSPSVSCLVLLGLTLGLLALDRAELAVLGLAVLVVSLLGASPRNLLGALRALLPLLVVAVLAVALVAPWSLYNESRFHRTVLVSNDLGSTLVGANCPQSYYGPLLGYDGTTCFLPVLARVLREHPHANEAANDSYFRSSAIKYAFAHTSRWPVVAAFRELWLWSLWRPQWTVKLATVYIGRPAWMTWTQIASFWALTPFALFGWLVARRRRIRVGALVTMVAFTALLGLLVVGHLRYRVSTEVAWVLFGAIALDQLGSRLRSGRARHARGGQSA